VNDHEEDCPCEECSAARAEREADELAEIAYWDEENPGWARELRNRR